MNGKLISGLIAGLCAATCLNMSALAAQPDMTADYVGTGKFEYEGRVMPVTIRGSGPLIRVDIAAAAIGTSTGSAMIMDREKAGIVTFPVGNVAPEMRMAMQIGKSPMPMSLDAAVAVGKDSIAGMSCTLYMLSEQSETGEVEDYTSCLTNDGIWLMTRDAAGKPLFMMETVARAPQSASLFAPPAGYRMMDMEQMAGGMAGMSGMAGIDMSAYGIGTQAPDPDETPENNKIKEIQDETGQQVEDRIDQERRNAVDKVLGSIFSR